MFSGFEAGGLMKGLCFTAVRIDCLPVAASERLFAPTPD